jgi:hypothetical protein
MLRLLEINYIIAVLLLATACHPTALSQESCQHAFIVYNADNGTEVTRFSDTLFPQLTFDQSQLSGISHLNLVTSLCNNDPPFQSMSLTVFNLTPYVSFSNFGPLPIIYETSSTVAYANMSGDFLQVPGRYMIQAISYSQGGEEGLPLDDLIVVVYVYPSCQRGFLLYDTNHQKEVARFPDVGIHTNGPTFCFNARNH